MNDTSAPRKDVQLGDQTVQARLIALNGKHVPVVKLGQIAEVKQGLATGDNDAYLFQNPAARGTYRSIDDYRQFLLTEADLVRIQQNERLRMSVIEKGISKNDPKSERYFGGRFIVPYDKGGESDVETGWMPNYFVATNYFIDWSEWAVDRLLTLTTRERNRKAGEPGGNEKLCSRFQNKEFYFRSGFDYSPTGIYSPTIRKNTNAIFCHKASSIFIEMSGAEQADISILGILSSTLSKFLLKNYAAHTVESPEGRMLESPLAVKLILLDKFSSLVFQIVAKQKLNPRYDYASHEQVEIDRLVYEAYGLNAEDVAEVETWYERRYPKLAEAQARNRERAQAAQPHPEPTA